MTTYDELRVVVSPSMDGSGDWTLSLHDCPDKSLIGKVKVTQPTLTTAHLSILRKASGWPNQQALRAIGKEVWQSTFGALDVPFSTLQKLSRQQQRGLRLVLVQNTPDNEVPPAGKIAVAEIPVEALYSAAADSFLALDEWSPVSRGVALGISSDIPPHRVDLPLRILVVVAKPSDMPPAAVTDEVAAIKEALSPLGGKINLAFCDPGTYEGFKGMLASHRPHVIHFIGHGTNLAMGDDLTRQPYLCFVRADNGQSRPIDVTTLNIALMNTEVRLAVLTACSTAAPVAPPTAAPVAPSPSEAYGPRALDGFAQRLVRSTSGVSAAVGMQIDFDADAAVAFSLAFYTHLLEPDRSLDEVVSLARKEIVAKMMAGHRAWVAPTVCWRCDGGKVFEIDSRTLGAAERQQLQVLDNELELQLDHLGQVARSGSPLVNLMHEWLLKIKEIQRLRGELLGETLELSVEEMSSPGEVTVHVRLRIETKGKVDLVKLKVQVPAELTLSRTIKSDACPHPPAVGHLQGDGVQVLIAEPSNDAEWPPGKHELGSLVFTTKADQPTALFKLGIVDPQLLSEGKRLRLSPLLGCVLIQK
ncbi:MAG TPA: CHAT domain-containing protein [Polyangiaceae bacterium]|nr:CHAT domain-containing protein [Polyangiaceae bacterium]